MYNILIAEDDKFTSEGLRAILLNEGYSVDCASNGQLAFDKINSKHYDLIVSDIMMPEMDGLKFLHRIRNRNSSVPVIIITAYGNTENILSAYDLGAVDILEKPFDVPVLLDLIKNVLKVS